MTFYDELARRPNPDSPDWIVGYTTREHLCLDLDNSSLPKVVGLIQLLMAEWPHIGDCAILGSSTRAFFSKMNYPPLSTPTLKTARNCYHAIFDNLIPYEESCKVVETIARLGVINEEYVRIREMRNDMTVRVSKSVLMDETKPAPVPLLIICNPFTTKHDGCVARYFSFLWACRHL